MRSSKSRSRSKQNRPRSIGNIVNRVFDSSGPEGKVRGTPQQIIEKYQALARDAQLSNDRVAAENFLQHAEHYTRMLGEAMREMAAEQEARRHQHGGNGQGQQGQGDRGFAPRRDDREDDQPDIGPVPVFAFDDGSDEVDSTLVETPETRTEPARSQPQQQPQRNERRDDRPRRDRDDRGDRAAREDQPRREDRAPREDRPPREDQPRRDRDERRREDRPRRDRTEAEATPAPEAAPQPVPAAAEPAQPVPEPAAETGEARARRPRAPRKPKTASPSAPDTEAAE
jgi:Domain of unknown function (DUF4167)